MTSNPVGLDGIEFAEFSSPDPDKLAKLFQNFGFSQLMEHQSQAIDLYSQGEIFLLLNRQQGSFSESFHKSHGPCLSSMGWRVEDPDTALAMAVSRGAKGSYWRL